jgi:hypothetical protein
VFGVQARFDVLVAELEAGLVAAADDLVPDQIGLHARLQRFLHHALLRQIIGELLGALPHPARHVGVGIVDILVDVRDGVAPEQLDLELLVDQLLDHRLARRLLTLVAELHQPHALVDVVVGDRIAVDQHGDALGVRARRRNAQRGQRNRRDHHEVAKERDQGIRFHRSVQGSGHEPPLITPPGHC